MRYGVVMGWARVRAGVAAVMAAAALGAGTAEAQPGAAAATFEPSCVLGITSVDMPPGAAPWALGLMARSDGLDQRYGLGRYAPGGECADVPDWFRALKLRSEAVNRQNRLGPFAPDAG